MTDYLADSKDFIALTDVQVRELGDRHVFNALFINIALEHIQIVAPRH